MCSHGGRRCGLQHRPGGRVPVHLESGADRSLHHSISPAIPSCPPTFKINDTGRIVDVLDSPHLPEGYESLKVYILSTKKLLELLDYCASHNLYSFTTAVLLGMKDKLNIQSYIYDGYGPTDHGGLLLQSQHGSFQEDVAADIFNPDHPIRTKDRSDPSTYYSPPTPSASTLWWPTAASSRAQWRTA